MGLSFSISFYHTCLSRRFRSHWAFSIALHCQSVAVVNVCFDKDVLKEQLQCQNDARVLPGWLSSNIGKMPTAPIWAWHWPGCRNAACEVLATSSDLVRTKGLAHGVRLSSSTAQDKT